MPFFKKKDLPKLQTFGLKVSKIFPFCTEECLWSYWTIVIFRPLTTEGWNKPKYSLNRWLSHKVHHWATILRFLPTIWCLQRITWPGRNSRYMSLEISVLQKVTEKSTAQTSMFFLALPNSYLPICRRLRRRMLTRIQDCDFFQIRKFSDWLTLSNNWHQKRKGSFHLFLYRAWDPPVPPCPAPWEGDN